MVIDPPYGVELISRGAVTRNYKEFGYASTDDSEESVLKLIHEFFPFIDKITERVVLTPGVRLMFKYPRPDHVGAFYSPAGKGCNKWGFTCWHPIFYYGKDPYLSRGLGSRPDSFRYFTENIDAHHPCPMPLKSWQKLVERCSLPDETVLDPFMGSGTTGMACANLNRKFIGIEIEPKYFEEACRRIEKAKRSATIKHSFWK